MKIDIDSIRDSIDPIGLEKLKKLSNTLGWELKGYYEGYELIKRIEGSDESVYLIIDYESLGEKPLDEIMADSMRTFHPVAAACEMALSGAETNLYQFDDVEAVQKLRQYLDCTLDVKVEMLSLIRKVRERGINLINTENGLNTD